MQMAHASEEHEKVSEYFDLIDGHVLSPIENTDVRQSCLASLMLLFSAKDGWGRLLPPQSNAGVGERFKAFLPRLGPGYVGREEALWDLRNSVMHNGLNTASFMSHVETGEQHHLEVVPPENLLYVSTSVLLKDFRVTFERLKQEILQDPRRLVQAASRLCGGAGKSPAWGAHQVTPPPPGL